MCVPTDLLMLQDRAVRAVLWYRDAESLSISRGKGDSVSQLAAWVQATGAGVALLGLAVLVWILRRNPGTRGREPGA